ncbi:hypothetical protein NDU88_005424 [Pleurodeles waltl]|uniref:Uncharacterized protein n=1 Tax=Pleurodeles waltl TaxID=8319 RepID=A0AAV7MEK1_PLEWA|nr:hypothetical protein NDU88_005424 [Pleurodeles waltl]
MIKAVALPVNAPPLTSRHTTSFGSPEPLSALSLHESIRPGDRCNQCGSPAAKWALQGSLQLHTVSYRTGLVRQYQTPKGNDSPPLTLWPVTNPPPLTSVQPAFHQIYVPGSARLLVRPGRHCTAARAAQPSVALVPSSHRLPPGHWAPVPGL